jgi:uncharacterized protein YndB with AHSA1/START domain
MLSGTGHDSNASHELTAERMISGTPADVFDGFLSLYGPGRPDWVLESELDLRAGGTWRLVFQPPGVPRFRETRVFSEVDRPARLGYTATVAADGQPAFQTTVLMTFQAQGDQTRVRLTQSGFPDAATREEFAAAWPDVLSGVARRLAA